MSTSQHPMTQADRDRLDDREIDGVDDRIGQPPHAHHIEEPMPS